ncbi:hypothetical protein V3C41_00310 [Paenarthrobacter nicotinovorans]|uniref:Uncharacterized protein n=1 Tax=Paenarthrobacter nicotinovorans TaxID=29320 RepID=A0ABV0GLW5_PAENI
MASSSEINPSAIKKMTQEIQRGFDKNPIQLPVKADNLALRSKEIYNGSIVHGDNTHVSWGGQQSNVVNVPVGITAGFEPLSETVVRILNEIHASGLNPDDIAAANEASREILDEVTKEEPEQSRIRLAVTYLKGLLAPLVTRGAGSAAEGVEEGARGWAATAVESLGAGMSAAFQG